MDRETLPIVAVAAIVLVAATLAVGKVIGDGSKYQAEKKQAQCAERLQQDMDVINACHADGKCTVSLEALLSVVERGRKCTQE